MNELFFGGMPTGPEVRLLREKWPDPKEGDEFPYSEVTKLIGQPIGSPRFKSVTYAWRNELQGLGIIIECVPGKAFRVQSYEQVISDSYGDVRSVQRKLKRRRRKLAAIASTDPMQVAKRDHAARLCYQLETAANETTKRIASPSLMTLPKVPYPDASSK